MTGLVLCSHGTRSRPGAARVSRLVADVAAALPDVDVREAHVDVHPPYLEDVVTSGDVVVPLLLAPGHHVLSDIASAASRVGARATPALGPHDLLTSILATRLEELSRPLEDDDVVVLAAAGSSVAVSQQATRAAARALAVRLARPVPVGYGASCGPGLPQLVESLRARDGGGRVVVASYLLAPGHFHDRVLACGADAVTEPLLDGVASASPLVELVRQRYAETTLSVAV